MSLAKILGAFFNLLLYQAIKKRLFGKTGGDLKYQGNLGGYKILFFVKLEMVERIKGGFNE